MAEVPNATNLTELIRSTCREEINEILKSHLQSVVMDIKETVHAELHSLRESSQSTPSSLLSNHQQEVEILTAKVKSLEDELERKNGRLEQTQQAASRLVREAEAKSRETSARLHKIILENGLGSTEPTDEEVEKAFNGLSHSIFQFVIRYCSNHTSKRGIYGTLPPEAKNSWVVSIIALRVWVDWFDPEVRIFGFSPTDDKVLANFENTIQRIKEVPLLDIKEWRVRTCLLSHSFDPQGENAKSSFEKSAEFTYKKLLPYWHLDPVELKKRSNEIKSALISIFHQGFDIAMLFRRSKIDYLWRQPDVIEKIRPLSSKDVEEVASNGYQDFEQALKTGDDYKKVFGEVLKGCGPSGCIDEDAYLLRKCSVLLGPIQSPQRP